MSGIQTLDKSAEKQFGLVIYKALTIDELKASNYPDSKLTGIFIDSVHETDRNYSIGLITDHPRGPYVNIRTEKREDFLKKGTEEEAEEALKKLAFAIRRYIGGCFYIHPFYGAIYGSKSPTVATDFCIDLKDLDDALGVSIYLTENGKFDSGLTKDSVAMGLTIRVTPENTEKLMTYWDRANKTNPNQQSRDQAIGNDLGKQWDAEFQRYNPHVERWMLGRRKKSDIPPPMKVTHANVIEVMNHLQSELGFVGLEIRQVNYKGLTESELDSSNLPQDKISFME